MTAEDPPAFDENPGQAPLISDEINNQPLSARVPEAVGRGIFSTGTIVTLGAHELLLDFLLTLGRPHHLAARVVLPHAVAAMTANLLQRGMESYEKHFAPLNRTPQAPGGFIPGTSAGPVSPTIGNSTTTQAPSTPAETPLASGESPAPTAPTGSLPMAPSPQPTIGDALSPPAGPRKPQPSWPAMPVQNRPGSLRDTYGELKIAEDVVSGTYANAVMISHTESVFQFDFITNFLPHSTVACRVFLPVQQAPRLLEALRITLQRHAQNQLIARRRQAQLRQQPGKPPSEPGDPPRHG